MCKVTDGLKEVHFAPFFRNAGEWWEVTWKDEVYYKIKKDSPIADKLCKKIRELHSNQLEGDYMSWEKEFDEKFVSYPETQIIVDSGDIEKLKSFIRKLLEEECKRCIHNDNCRSQCADELEEIEESGFNKKFVDLITKWRKEV